MATKTKKDFRRSTKSSLKVDSTLLDAHKYFKKTFTFIDDDKKILCKTCQDGWILINVF